MRTPGRGVDGLGSVVAGSQLGAGRNWCTIKYMYVMKMKMKTFDVERGLTIDVET